MNDVLEYLFFTQSIANKFIAALQKWGISYTQTQEAVQGGIVLKIAETEVEAYWDELDALYDDLSAEDQNLLEAGLEDGNAKSTAGVYLQLQGGKQTVAQVDPNIMNRILSVISMEEFNAFIEIIVQSVEQPDDTPICKQ